MEVRRLDTDSTNGSPPEEVSVKKPTAGGILAGGKLPRRLYAVEDQIDSEEARKREIEQGFEVLDTTKTLGWRILESWARKQLHYINEKFPRAKFQDMSEVTFIQGKIAGLNAIFEKAGEMIQLARISQSSKNEGGNNE
jgi:hypothetical protein